jgi:hypothetical protein
MEKDMGKVSKYGMMELNMKVIGRMINLMVMVHFIILMEMYIRVIGKIIEQMEKESI